MEILENDDMTGDILEKEVAVNSGQYLYGPTEKTKTNL